jgi:hypothetical protein
MNFKKLFDYTVPPVAAATVLALGAIVVTVIAAWTAYDIKLSRDSIEVTGSAKEAVVADSARWIINLETRTGVNDQQSGFARIEAATTKITTYLKSQGFEDFETPSVSTYPSYTYPQYGDPILNGFSVSRQVIVRSSDVDNIGPFTGANYTVSTQALELTYSKLDEMRVKLLSEAIKDARARAEAIAKESGRSVSTLRSASGGVVQVLSEGAVDISDYGNYDTQSKNKEVMVTVRASFEL